MACLPDAWIENSCRDWLWRFVALDDLVISQMPGYPNAMAHMAMSAVRPLLEKEFFVCWMGFWRQRAGYVLGMRFLRSIARRLHGEACAPRFKLQFWHSMCASLSFKTIGQSIYGDEKPGGGGCINLLPPLAFLASLTHLLRSFISKRTGDAMMRIKKRQGQEGHVLLPSSLPCPSHEDRKQKPAQSTLKVTRRKTNGVSKICRAF